MLKNQKQIADFASAIECFFVSGLIAEEIDSVFHRHCPYRDKWEVVASKRDVHGQLSDMVLIHYPPSKSGEIESMRLADVLENYIQHVKQEMKK